jgi:hypothetical protein
MKLGSSLTEESVIVESTLTRIAHPAQIHPQEQPSRITTPDSLPLACDPSVIAKLGLFLEAFMNSIEIQVSLAIGEGRTQVWSNTVFHVHITSILH